MLGSQSWILNDGLLLHTKKKRLLVLHDLTTGLEVRIHETTNFLDGLHWHRSRLTLSNRLLIPKRGLKIFIYGYSVLYCFCVFTYFPFLNFYVPERKVRDWVLWQWVIKINSQGNKLGNTHNTEKIFYILLPGVILWTDFLRYVITSLYTMWQKGSTTSPPSVLYIRSDDRSV